ncbi:MAG TPA: hypothetical protein H9687_04355 [Firmicutes bacterium]|nr:hypothetical protein [Bacillota bacterium]
MYRAYVFADMAAKPTAYGEIDGLYDCCFYQTSMGYPLEIDEPQQSAAVSTIPVNPI